MPTHGSCLPLVIMAVSSPDLVTVLRSFKIDEVGFTAKRTTTSWLDEMPPRFRLRIFKTFPLAEAVAPRTLMESNAHMGEIMLVV